jgi:aminoglycoside 3'-phosphotransferase III
MEKVEMSKDLRKILSEMSCEIDDIGCSNAAVYKYTSKSKSYYLKIQEKSEESQREYDVIKWLQGILPVPEILHWESDKGFDYLLMSQINGEMSCSEKNLNKPETTIKLLAKGIKMLHSTDISNCPFNSSLEYKLRNAESNITTDKVDISDWNDDTEFESPQELLRYLTDNKPDEELVFSHGDYCLPNIFISNDKISGFIDLGRAGVADKWQDIALCVRSIKYNFNTDQYINLFFQHLNMKPDWEKIRYFILLDELF